MREDFIHNNLQRETIRLFAQVDAWFDHDYFWLNSIQQDGVSVAARLVCLYQSSFYYLNKATDKPAPMVDRIMAKQLAEFYEHLFDPIAMRNVPEEELNNIRFELRGLLERCLLTLDLLDAGSHAVDSFERSGVYMNLSSLLLHGNRQLNAIREMGQKVEGVMSV